MHNEISIQDIDRLLTVGGSAIGGVSKTGWSINALELAKASEHLELKLLVTIRFGSGYQKTGGHRIKTNGTGKYWHYIKVSNRLSKVSANETLWHELAHAWQVEQWVKQHNKSPMLWRELAYEGRGYKNNPYEIHARKVAKQMKGWMLLI